MFCNGGMDGVIGKIDAMMEKKEDKDDERALQNGQKSQTNDKQRDIQVYCKFCQKQRFTSRPIQAYLLKESTSLLNYSV